MIRAGRLTGVWALWMLALSGCAVQPIQRPDEASSDFGWIAIDGATIPAETATVPQCGISLIDCLQESSLPALLRQRNTADRPGDSNLAAGDPSPSRSDSHSSGDLGVLWTAASTPLVADTNKLQAVTDKVIALLDSHPNLTISNGWTAGWPHYLLERDGQLSSPSRTLIESWANADCRDTVSEVLDTVQGGVGRQRDDAITRLQALLREQCFAVPIEHQARAWCFAGIGYERTRNSLLLEIRQALASDQARDLIDRFMNNHAGDFAVLESHLAVHLADAGGTVREQLAEAKEKDAAWREFYTELKSWQIAPRMASDAISTARVAADVFDPQDELCLLVRTTAGENILLPMAMVYESALGGLWLFPGDRLTVFQFRELPFASAESGEKRVAILGLVPEELLLQTPFNFVHDVVQRDLPDRHREANLIRITSQWNGLIVHIYLPADPSLLSKTNQQMMEALLKRWSVVDGSAWTFEAAALSPLLLRSKIHQRRAALEAAESKALAVSRAVSTRLRMGHGVPR